MLCQPADIIDAFRRRWAESPVLLALIPGGVHQGRVPMNSAGSQVLSPYGKIDCVERERQQNSSTTLIQVFTVTLSIWSEHGATDNAEIGRAIDLTFDRSRAVAELAVNPADKVIDLLDLPAELTLDEKTREATDQVVTVRRWEMWVQATRA